MKYTNTVPALPAHFGWADRLCCTLHKWWSWWILSKIHWKVADSHM